MANSSFPLYLRPQYEAGSAASQFSRDIDALAKKSEAQFRQAFGNIGQTIQSALAVPRNAGGALDLGTGQYQQAAKEARILATASREVATAASIAAREGGKTRADLRLFATDANNAAREANQYAVQLERVALVNDRVQAELNKTKSATDALINAQGRGTTANGALVNSTRAVRQATTQAGQQLQDIAISIGSGQRASTVFAQQLPQLAFAFSGVTGAAGSMAARIGSVATFLAGPWGVLVAVGAFALGPLIDGLFKADDASKKAKDSTFDFSKGLDFLRLSAEETSRAVKQLSDETGKLIDVQADLITQNLNVANTAISAQQAKLDGIDQQIAARRKNVPNALERVLNPIGAAENDVALKRLQNRRNAEAESLLTAQQARINAEIAASQRSVNQSLDAGVKLTDEYNESVRKLVKARQLGGQQSNLATFDANKGTGLSKDQFETQLRNLQRTFDAEKKILDQRKSARSSNSERDTRSRAQVLADFRRELEARGVDTISGYRTAGQQNALFKQGATPADGYKIPSQHQSFRAVDIDKNTFNAQKIYEAGQAAGIRGLQIITESGGRKHLQFTGSGKPGTVDDKQGDRIAREIETANRAAEQLQNELNGISLAVTRIGGEFDRQPRFIDRATLAAEKLKIEIANIDKLLAGTEIGDAQRITLEADKKAAQNTLTTEIPRAVRQPFDDITKQAERELELQNLRLAGREVEATLLQQQVDLMQRYGVETEEELARQLQIAGITKEQYLTQQKIQVVLLTNRNIEQERLARLGQTLDDRLGRLRELREVAIATISDAAATGEISAKNLFSTINRQFADQFGRKFFEDTFGKAFQSEEDRLLDKKIGNLGSSADRMAKAFDAAAVKINNFANGVVGANDNPSGSNDALSQPATIVNGIVQGQKDFARLITKSLDDLFGINGPAATSIGNAVQGALEGAQAGGFIGSAFGSGGGKVGRIAGSIFGGANSLLGANSPLAGISAALPQIGAVLQASSALSSLLGNDQKKGGKILGPLSPFLTAIFGSSLKGSATIGSLNGSLGVTGTSGNSKARKKTSTDAASTVIEQLKQLAEQLGGDINASAGSASIGIRKKNYILDPTGKGRTKGAGTINFGKDEDAAIAAARALALDLINDGVITGLREGSKKLLANAKTLEAGLEKALKFQSVFDRLKARKDPLGAALDGLDREFSRLKTIFDEAGASIAERAQLEELYGLERADVMKEVGEKIVGSLRDLYNELTVGNDARSLTERLGFAQSKFDPLAARVAAGDATAYDDFAAAARELLDIQRQFSGSQSGYFDLLNRVTDLTRTTLGSADSGNFATVNRDSPFTSTGSVAANSNVVGAIDAQTNSLLAALNIQSGYLQKIANDNGLSSGAGAFNLSGQTFF